jgi:hypothetical protein
MSYLCPDLLDHLSKPFRTMDKNKLRDILDVAILRHGFSEYNRDYDFVFETDSPDDSGQFLLRFKHVYELSYLTALTTDTLKVSTSDNFTDYKKWLETGEKEGFVWGVNYALAYPGFTILDNSAKADKWTKILGFEMFNVTLETETYKIDLVTSDFEIVKLNDDTDLIKRLFIKLK